MTSDSTYQENIEGIVQSILRGIGEKIEAAHGIVVAIVESALAEPDPGQALFDEVLRMVQEARSAGWADQATSLVESHQAQEWFDAALAFFQEGRHAEFLDWAASRFASRSSPEWFDTLVEFREEARSERWLDGLADSVEEAGAPGWLTTAARWVEARTRRDVGEVLTVPEAWMGPHPLNTPTAEEGAALAALDSGRWMVEPGSNRVSSRGHGPSPSGAVGLGELHSRDWVTTVGGLTVAGRHALGRWLAASS